MSTDMSTSDTSPVALDESSQEPVFAQIRDAVKAAVGEGRLPAGSRLPTTRALAEELGVAVNTVAKAYRELEREAVIEGRGRQGTFVLDQGGHSAEREALRYVSLMRSLGVDKDEALELVDRAWP